MSKTGRFIDDPVNQRFKIAFDSVISGSIRQTAAEMDVPPSNLSHILAGDRGVNPKIAAKFGTLYNVNTDWVFTGRGSMLFDPPKDETPDVDNYVYNDVYKPPDVHLVSDKNAGYLSEPNNVQPWTDPETGREWLVPVMQNTVPVLQQRAYGGTPGGFADVSPDEPRFMSLPEHPGYNAIALQVYGDSMAPTIHDGDLVVAAQLTDLSAIKDNRVYIVLIADEGATIKRVINRSEAGYLVLKGDNRSYSAARRRIELDQVVCVYEVRLHMSANLSGPVDIYDRLSDLERLYHDLKDDITSLK